VVIVRQTELERSDEDRADEEERGADRDEAETWSQTHGVSLPQVELAQFYQEFDSPQAIKLLHCRIKKLNKIR
jgi:hypothetical protein